MKNITPKDTRYVPFTQQQSCCVPTSMSIVMYKLGIPLIPPELLGYHLGLILNKKYKNLFWNVRTGKRPKAGYGTRVYEKRYNTNTVFKKLKIPLKTTDYSINDFTKKELISFISDNIKKDKDLIVLLNSDVLNNTNNNNGHACVIDRIYPSKDIIRLIDPSEKQAKWREMKINKFIKAMKKHPSGQGRLTKMERIK